MEQQGILSDLVIDSAGVEHIRGFAGWAKFLSIIGFIMCGLLALGSFFIGTFFTMMGGYNQYGGVNPLAGMGAMFTVIYLIIAVVYFIPTLFLYQSATKLKAAIGTTDQVTLNEGFAKLKASFRFVGILMIIFLSFYALIILFAILAAAFR